MPYTTWGLMRAIRSHTVDSPNVAVTISTGRPNACNECHLDRTLEWTAERLNAWYGQSPPDLSPEERELAASILWTLSGDAVQRALMAWAMGWAPAREVSGTQWMVPYLSLLLVDRYDVVRLRAQRTLSIYPEYQAVVRDSVSGSTWNEQDRMKNAILAEWGRRFARAPDRAGPAFLIDAAGVIDRTRFGALVTQRHDRNLVLFE